MVDTSIIKRFEGCKLKAYLCPANKWTIGYGSTRHPDGREVKDGDVIKPQDAEAYLAIEVRERLRKMGLPSTLNANQQAALVSFQYNVGHGNWMASNLRRRVMADPLDPLIRKEFMKWVRAGGKRLQGLVNRRQAEADLYFS